MSWCPAVSVEDFIRGLVSPSPQLMNSRKLPSAHADRCPATVAAGQWVVLMVSTISFLIHPCFWGRSIIFVQFVSGRSKMVVGQSSFNLYQKIKDLLRDTLMRIGDCRRMITNGAPLISPTSWCSLFSTTSSPSIQLMRSRTATHPHMSSFLWPKKKCSNFSALGAVFNKN